MERYEAGDDERVAALVEAARRGDEAVITMRGTIVAEIRPRTSKRPRRLAEPLDIKALQSLRDRLPLPEGNGQKLVRELRDDVSW